MFRYIVIAVLLFCACEDDSTCQDGLCWTNPECEWYKHFYDDVLTSTNSPVPYDDAKRVCKTKYSGRLPTTSEMESIPSRHLACDYDVYLSYDADDDYYCTYVALDKENSYTEKDNGCAEEWESGSPYYLLDFNGGGENPWVFPNLICVYKD